MSASYSADRQIDWDPQQHNEQSWPGCGRPVHKQNDEDDAGRQNVETGYPGISQGSIGTRGIRLRQAKAEYSRYGEHVKNQCRGYDVLEQVTVEISPGLSCRIVGSRQHQKSCPQTLQPQGRRRHVGWVE